MENEKETKTYRFEKEVIKHAELNPMIPSFAEWACDRYRKEFMEISTLSKKMQMYIDMSNDCKERMLELKKEESAGHNIELLKPNELLWIKQDAAKRCRRGTFEGVYKFFVNTYEREDINRRQFKLLIERFNPGIFEDIARKLEEKQKNDAEYDQ